MYLAQEKTPTCIYFSDAIWHSRCQLPLTEDDLDGETLPKVLKNTKQTVGLMIDAERLTAIRNERKANSRYASSQQCQQELRAIESIYRMVKNIKYLNVSEMSVEEIATRIIQLSGLKRRIN